MTPTPHPNQVLVPVDLQIRTPKLTKNRMPD
jgi:hypothetical protein